MARPTIYNQELANELCKRIAQGKSLRSVCSADDMPDMSIVFDWIHSKPEFSNQYAQATGERSEAQHEELTDLSDEVIREVKAIPKTSAYISNALANAYKLKADNLKWSMSKMKPKKYGDKLDMTTNGKDIPTPIYSGGSNKV